MESLLNFLLFGCNWKSVLVAGLFWAAFIGVVILLVRAW